MAMTRVDPVQVQVRTDWLRGTPKEYTDALGQSATKVLVLEPGAIARF